MQNIPPELVPKAGVKTSSFKVLIATLLVGAVFTYLVRRGVVPESYLAPHRDEFVNIIAQSLPAVYLALVGYLSRAYMKYRERVGIAKAGALQEAVRGLPKLSYRELLSRVRDEETVLPVLSKVTSIGEISPPEHLAALTRLAQEVGNNRRDIAVILLALEEAGIIQLEAEDRDAIHKTK